MQTVSLAIQSQADETDVEERAGKFLEKYLEKINTLANNPWYALSCSVAPHPL